MGCVNSAPVVQGYYDPDGTMVFFEHPKQHSAKKEFVYVSGQDSKQFHVGDSCYIISSTWHSAWADFVTNKTRYPPGPINNKVLFLFNGDSFRTDLKPKKDYRPINKAVWEFYFRKYGGGPTITFSGE